MRRSLLVPGLSLAFVLAVSAVVAVGALTGSDDTAGRMPPRPDVPLRSSVESAGIRVDVTAAAFSASGTYVELAATAVDGTGGIRFLRIPAHALTARSLALAADAPLNIGRPTIVRFSPATPGRDIVFETTALELVLEGGATEVRAGTWTLELDAPGDLAARLRSEALAGSGVEDAGVRVIVEGGLRSTTETLVTVRVEGEVPLAQLGQPTLVSGGRLLQGGLVDEADGGLLTFAFPPTAFGEAVTVRFGPFVRSGAESTGSVTIDLGAIIDRHGMTGAHNESAPILASDISDAAGADLAPAAIRFSGCNSSRYPGMKCLNVEVGGIWDSWETVLTVTDASGEAFDAGVTGTGYTKDPTGVISSRGRTIITLYYGSLDDLRTRVQITVSGNPSETVRGEWTVNLEPLATE